MECQDHPEWHSRFSRIPITGRAEKDESELSEQNELQQQVRPQGLPQNESKRTTRVTTGRY